MINITSFIDNNLVYLIFVMPFVSQLGIPVGVTFYIMYFGSTLDTYTQLLGFILIITICFNLADVFGFLIGERFGETPLKIIEKKFSLKKIVLKTELILEKNVFLSMIFTRTIFLGGAAIVNYLLGIRKFNIKKFILYASISEIIYVTIFTLIGYLLKDLWEVISLLIEDFSSILFILFIIVVLVTQLFRKKRI